MDHELRIEIRNKRQWRRVRANPNHINSCGLFYRRRKHTDFET